MAPGREVEYMQRDLPRRLVFLKVRQSWKLDISPSGAGYKRDTDCYKRWEATLPKSWGDRNGSGQNRLFWFGLEEQEDKAREAGLHA